VTTCLEPELVTCQGCQHPTPADGIAKLTVHAQVDGRNSKHRGQFCLMCWETTFEPMLGIVQPANPTGSTWSQS
jgi:hypothetical protein